MLFALLIEKVKNYPHHHPFRSFATWGLLILWLVGNAPTVAAQPLPRLFSDTLTIHFRLDSTRVDMYYADNALNWLTFEQRLRAWKTDHIEAPLQIDIFAGASPEGPALHNWQLGRERGQSLRRLICDKLGDQVGRIVVHNEAARWDAFYQAVAQSNEPWRDEVLAIIDQPASANSQQRDHRERQLRRLNDGQVWPVLLEHYLAPLRSGATAIVRWRTDGSDTIVVRDTVFLGGPATPVAPADSAHPIGGMTHADSIAAAPCWQPLLALKTNLFFDALLAVNAEVEVPIGWSRWSLMAEWWGPWYCWRGNNLKNRAYEVLTIGAELRYWLSPREAVCPRLLCGQFAGIYAAGGKYDIQPGTGGRHHEGWQGEFTSLGLTYGCAWWLGRHWRLEASASIGYVGGPQRYYHGMFDDTHLIWQRNRHFDYFGPTKLKVSLAYLIGRQTKKKGGSL